MLSRNQLSNTMNFLFRTLVPRILVSSERFILPSVSQNKPNFLQPMLQQQSLVPAAGFHHVGKPKKRCASCYFVVKDETLMVLCDAKPRHKQIQRKPPPKMNWIMTSATQGGARRGNGKGRREMWTQQGFRMDF